VADAVRPERLRRHTLLVCAASLFATIPVWIPTFPPMTDLPQHASQIALLRHMLSPDFRFASYFHINWFTPYLLGYLLVYAIAPVVGIVAACKTVIALAIASLPLATMLLMSETGADRRWALLAIPAMYGFSYYWGFLNFLVAAPLGLIFVWLTLRYARSPSLATAVALGITINALFFCHAMICAFFGFVAGCILLLSAGNLRTAVGRVLPLASVIPIMVVWGTRTMANPLAKRPTLWDLNWLTTQDGYYTAIASWTDLGGWGWGRTAGMFPRLLGVRPGVVATFVGLTLFLLPLAAGARFSKRLIVWVPFITCMVTLLFVPGILFGTDFTFQRFTVFALPLYLITLQSPGGGWPRWTWPACVVLAGGWIAVVSANAVRYEADAAGFVEILSRMEPGERALSFEFERDSLATIAPPFLHFPAWYSALKGGVVDPNIAGTHVQLVLYRPEYQPAARLWGFEWFPGMYDWRRFDGEQYRYFVARAAQNPGPGMFRGATCDVRLVHHVNHWWLYERDPHCVPTPPFRS
jgi:hypothetical protein